MRRRLTTRLAAIAAATVLGLVAAFTLTATPSAPPPRPTEVDVDGLRPQHAEADHEGPHAPHAAQHEG